MTPKARTWTRPAWLTDDLLALVPELAGSGRTVEDVMNCDAKNCNVVVNAPRAMACQSASSQVILLQRLHNAGRLR